MALEIPLNINKIRQIPFNLSPGNDNEGVSEVKKYLHHYGYFVGPSDFSNTFDDRTQTAVRKFQRWFQLTETGLLDGPTKAALTRRRCALSGGNPVAASIIGPWPQRNLNYVFGPTSQDLDSASCKNAVRRAFRTWESAGVGLTFTETAAATAHMYIDWRNANDPDLDMRGGTLAHADFPPGFSIIVDRPPLPIHFDDSENVWVDGRVANAYDIETVALHEIGHCLGLLHSNVPGAVMFPTVSDNHELRTLTNDDRDGIRQLYP